MSQSQRDQLRALYAIKPPEPKAPPPNAGDTLPILKLSDLDLSPDAIDDQPNYTFGYDQTLERDLSGISDAKNSQEERVRGLPPIKNRDNEVIDQKYRIISALGAGGASEVYLCERMLVGDRVALKMLRANVNTDPETARRFHLEALTTASIKHPNVITIHDFDFTNEGTPFMVMELLRGQTLLGEIKRIGRIPLRQAVQTITPICSALNVAHRRSIIHRDLKPANIVLHRMDDDTEVIKLIDFGIAKQFIEPKMDLRTMPGLVVGTPAYMAPERCLEEPYDTRADIYNLGLIFYEMVSGHHPFPAKTMMAMMAKQISEEPPSLTKIVPDLPEAVEQVVFKALAKLPDNRYSTSLEFADELNSAFYASWLH